MCNSQLYAHGISDILTIATDNYKKFLTLGINKYIDSQPATHWLFYQKALLPPHSKTKLLLSMK